MKKLSIAIVAVVIISITVASVLSFDVIIKADVSKSKYGEYGVYTVTNEMKSGENTKINVLCTVKPLADGVSHVQVNVSNSNITDSDGKNLQSKNYEIRNIRVNLCIDGEPLIEYAVSSGREKSGSLIYASPRLSYYDGKITASYEAAGSDVMFDMFVIGEFDLKEIDLTYDIKGKGVRLLNSFIDNSVAISIST